MRVLKSVVLAVFFCVMIAAVYLAFGPEKALAISCPPGDCVRDISGQYYCEPQYYCYWPNNYVELCCYNGQWYPQN